MIGWSKYRLRLPCVTMHCGLMWPVGIPTIFIGHWQSPCTPGGYSVRKLLGVCRGPLKIGPQKIEGKMVFWGQKDRILWGFVPKRSFLCWWMRKNTPKRSSLVPRGSKKGVKTAAHMYHPSYREYSPRALHSPNGRHACRSGCARRLWKRNNHRLQQQESLNSLRPVSHFKPC